MLGIALVSLYLAAQAEPMTPPAGATQSFKVLRVPDAIVPAILPYQACLLASKGTPFRHGTSGGAYIPEGIRIGSDCTEFRRRAKQQASDVLAGKGDVNAGLTVEDTLREVDLYVGSLTQPGSVEGSGGLIVIEDELLPSYQKYQGCLVGRSRDSGATKTGIVAIHESALRSCKSDRARLIEESVSALAIKGWDETKRRMVAQTTFDQIDQLWRSAAQIRIKQSVRPKTSKRAKRG